MKHILVLLLLLPTLAYTQNHGIEVKLSTQKSIYTNNIYIYSNYLNSYARVDGRFGEKIPINRIKYIQGTDNEGHKRYFTPIRYKGYTRWGERTFVSERIKIYSTTKFDLNYPAKAGDVYIKDHGSIQDLKYKFLKQDLSDDPVAMEYLKKANGLRTTQTLFWTASVGLFIAGVVKMSNTPLGEPGEESVSIPPAFLLASGVNLVAWILEIPKREKFREALQNYN